MSGNCDVVVPMLAEIVPSADSESIMPLAVSFTARQAVLPEVPSVAELGYPELVETVWRVISAPKETPPDVIDYIIPGNDDAIRAIKLFVTAMAEACLEGDAMRKDSKNKDAEEELQKAAAAEAKAEEAVVEAAE